MECGRVVVFWRWFLGWDCEWFLSGGFVHGELLDVAKEVAACLVAQDGLV